MQLYLLLIAIFALSVTVCEILLVEVCITLNLCDFLWWQCPICHHLQDIHIWTSQCTWFLDSNLWPWNESQLRWRFRWKLAYESILSVRIRMQKLALLDPAICSQFIIAHFVTDMHIQHARKTPLNSIGTVEKPNKTQIYLLESKSNKYSPTKQFSMNRRNQKKRNNCCLIGIIIDNAIELNKIQ